MGLIFRRFCLWLSNTNFYAFMVLKVIPHIRFTTGLTPTRGNQYHDAYNLIRRGDFIVTKDKNKMTSLLISGDWSHAVYFMGKLQDGEAYECAEMTHHNFTKSDFFDVVKESSEFAIYRCVDDDPEYCIKKTQFVKNHFTMAKYDTGFELGVRSLYCSELVYLADFEKRMKASLQDLVSLGRPYISPTGLSKAERVTCIYHSKNTRPRY